jgi:hypothetical protein
MGEAPLPRHLAGPALADAIRAERVAGVLDRLASRRRAQELPEAASRRKPFQLRLGRRRLQARFLFLPAFEPASLVELRTAVLAAARFGPLRCTEDCHAPPRGATAPEVETDA